MFIDQMIFPVAASKQNASPQRLNVKRRSPTMVGVPVVPPSKNLSPRSAGYECFQRTFPVLASKHQTVSCASAWPSVNPRLPATTNDEKPRPTFAFQAINGPLEGQVSLQPFSVDTPFRCGPRH